MKIRITVLLTAAALTSSLPGCTNYPYYGDARAQDRNYDPYYDDTRMHDRDYDARIVFSEYDRRVIHDYYRNNYRNLPPGLAKKGKVPPGHAYKMRRHQGIPHDVTWQYLPSDVERRLSRLPDGYVRAVIGYDVGILHTRTRVVLDVIEDLHN